MGISIIFAIFQLLITIIKAQDKCDIVSDCDIYQYGYYCTRFCADGCVEVSRDANNNMVCMNKTDSDPLYYISFGNNANQRYSEIIPGQSNYTTLMNFINSSNFDLIKTDYLNNIYGQGVSCPVGCFERNRECIPLNTKYICYPEKQLQCPDQYNCVYSKMTNSCSTTRPYVLCGTNHKYKKCPTGCSYDINTNSCFSPTPGQICDLGYTTVCPQNCGVNYDDSCVPSYSQYSQYPNTICHHVPIPQCADGCYYNFTQQTCMSKNGDNFCVAYVYINCVLKYGYDFDLNKVNSCSYNMKNNINDLCLDDYGRLKFPLSLIEKYKNIKCKYSDIYCSYNRCNEESGGCPSYFKRCPIQDDN